MTVLKGLLLGGKAWKVAPAATVSSGGGTGVVTPTPTGPPVITPAPGPVTTGLVHSFSLTNWGAGTSAGFAKQGVVFAKGDIPSGAVPQVQLAGAAVAHQWDSLTRWTDGSWKFAVVSVGAPTFAASEARKYDIVRVAGTPNNATNLTLAAALAGTSFAATFASVQQWDGTTATTRGSGAFSASLNTHAAVPTRVTRLASGPVRDAWMIWGMARDNATGVEDPHLKIYWYVDAWKNPDGSIYSLEVAPVPAQDWWSIAGKYRLIYDAAFTNGATTIASYAGVQHPYRSWWIMCRTASDNNIGKRYWIGGAIPTLGYTVNKAYWKASRVIPPPNLKRNPASYSASLTAYVPCGAADHRANVDGTGAYAGRGLLPLMDSIAFVRQTPFDTAIMRVNGHAGLHFPQHYRSNRLRIRPGDTVQNPSGAPIMPADQGKDIASTPIVLNMLPLTAAQNDFTADGMPLAADAYADRRTASYYQDGYVQPAGGDGVWTPSGDASHAVAYSTMSYLFEGEAYHAEAMIDIASNCFHQTVGQNDSMHNGPLLKGDGRFPSIQSSMPSTPYSAILYGSTTGNSRAFGWAINQIAQASALIPDNHVAKRYMRALMDHQGDWMDLSLPFYPSSMAAAGWLCTESQTLPGQQPPWFNFIGCMAFYYAFQLTERATYQKAANQAANLPTGMVASGGNYLLDVYRVGDTRTHAAWDPLTNDFWPPGQLSCLDAGGSTVAGSSTVTMSQNWDANGNRIPLQNGDQVFFSIYAANSNNRYIPTEIVEGRVYYLVNVANGNFGSNNPATGGVATSPGGTPITFSVTANIGLGVRPQFATAAVGANPPYIPLADSYARMGCAAMEMAVFSGYPPAAAQINAARTFIATPAFDGLWMPWELYAT